MSNPPDPTPSAPQTNTAPGATTEIDVAIIGAGFSGIGLGVKLKQEGRRSFVIFEQNDAVGGTWLANHYPGCACDIPSHLYSYSFAPNPAWSRAYSPQGEILDYIKGVARDFGLEPHLRLNTEVRDARWDDDAKRWRVFAADGRELASAKLLFSAFGFLSKPAIANIEGQDSFQGEAFHTAEWRDDIDLSGKRVAVVGTGASAIQVVPNIIDRVSHLDLYQRTAPWIVPRNDHSYSSALKGLFKVAPWLRALWRGAIYWRLEANAYAFLKKPELLKKAEKIAKEHLERQVSDPELRTKLEPDYHFGCKRVLIADNYFPALTREHTDLITSPVVRLTATGVVAEDGVERPADVVIFATGFRIADALSPLDFYGRDGRSLQDSWAKTPQAYLGLAASGFPNLFFLIGPNTGLGHNSMIYMLESQLNFIMDALAQIDAEDARTVEVKGDAQAAFNAEIQAKFDGTVWESGCVSWYKTDDGANPTLWPSYTFDYRKRTRRMNPADFTLER